MSQRRSERTALKRVLDDFERRFSVAPNPSPDRP
jgi:hypothetical protein